MYDKISFLSKLASVLASLVSYVSNLEYEKNSICTYARSHRYGTVSYIQTKLKKSFDKCTYRMCQYDFFKIPIDQLVT